MIKTITRITSLPLRPQHSNIVFAFFSAHQFGCDRCGAHSIMSGHRREELCDEGRRLQDLFIPLYLAETPSGAVAPDFYRKKAEQ